MKEEIATVTSNGEVKKEVAIATETTQLSGSDMKEVRGMLGKIKEMKVGVSLVSQYYEFENPGDSIRGIFLGFKNLTIKDDETGTVKEIPAVGWIDENENVFVNAGVALVNVFVSNAIQPKTPVEITLTRLEKSKSSAGKIKIYDVRPLISVE